MGKVFIALRTHNLHLSHCIALWFFATVLLQILQEYFVGIYNLIIAITYYYIIIIVIIIDLIQMIVISWITSCNTILGIKDLSHDFSCS